MKDNDQRAMQKLLREKKEQQERQAREFARGRGPVLMPGVKPIILGNKNGW